MSTCRTCGGVPDCYDGHDRYSLQDDVYYFVESCPEGYDCSHTYGRVSMLCCDGTEISVWIPDDATDAQRAAKIKQLVDSCGQRIAFCGKDPLNPVTDTPEDGDGGGQGNNNPVVYMNAAVTITLTCPAGGSSTYTLPAGRYLGYDAGTVFNAANREANRLARINRICISSIASSMCDGSAQDITLACTGPGASHTWTITEGSLPTGLALENIGVPVAGYNTKITGTPTTGGSFTFKLRSTAPDGTYGERSYTVCVGGITPASLDDATIDTAYEASLTASPCHEPPLVWAITDGLLPDGLSLDTATGVISGTPLEDGSFTFTVSVQTQPTT